MKKRFGDVDLPHDKENRSGKKVCVWCGKGLAGRKLRWCSQECVDQYLVRNNSTSLKSFIFKRDHGICAICGLDCLRLERVFRYSRIRAGLKKNYAGPWAQEYSVDSLFKKQYQPQLYNNLLLKYPWLEKFNRWERDLYELDHIVPVVKGGGSCPPENIRTLCYQCHRKVTSDLMGQLAYEKSKLKNQRK